MIEPQGRALLVRCDTVSAPAFRNRSDRIAPASTKPRYAATCAFTDTRSARKYCVLQLFETPHRSRGLLLQQVLSSGHQVHMPPDQHDSSSDFSHSLIKISVAPVWIPVRRTVRSFAGRSTVCTLANVRMCAQQAMAQALSQTCLHRDSRLQCSSSSCLVHVPGLLLFCTCRVPGPHLYCYRDEIRITGTSF